MIEHPLTAVGHRVDHGGMHYAALVDETWISESDVEEPPVVAGLAGEAGSPLATSSHCGAFQPQDEPWQMD